VRHSKKEASTPFQVRYLNAIAQESTASVDQQTALKLVTKQIKQQIDSADQLAPENITRYKIKSRMLGPKTQSLDLSQSDWVDQISDAYIIHIPDGFVGDNVIFDQNNYYWFKKWWLGPDWTVYQSTEKIQVETSWVISIAAWGGEAFQHFIMDVFPKLALVVELLEAPEYQHIKIASHYKNCPIAQWIWSKLNLQDRLIQKPLNAADGFVIHTPMALYPGFHPSHQNFGFYPRNCLLPLQKRLGLLEDVPQDLIVYLPRKGQREVDNETELLSMLVEFACNSPYELHIFKHSGNFDQDLSIMRRAKIVLGPHGGAFANIAFTQPGTSVIEFLPILDLADDILTSGRNYWGLSQAAGLDYWAFEPSRFSFEGSMLIDCAELQGVLQKTCYAD